MTQSTKAATCRTRPSKFCRLLSLFLIAVMVAVIVVAPLLMRAMGGRISGARLTEVSRSPHFSEGKFRNREKEGPVPGQVYLDQLKHWLFGREQRVPSRPIPVAYRHSSDYASQPASGLRATWMGHSTVLIEIDGYRILTDPVWSERASPLTFVGPRRFHPVPISIAELPRLDLVVISHDHYDHLDMRTVELLSKRGTRFVVPLGVGAHLQAWGISLDQITELDCGERTDIGSLGIIATPARHYSGRNPFHNNETFWASFVIVGPRHRVFFSGDTGYTKDLVDVGLSDGPFDLTLIKIGSSDPTWAEIHMTPEEAVQTHLDVKGAVMLPIHWGTFNLAFHAWDEPLERALLAARNSGVRFVVPRPGQLVEPTQPPTLDFWWREVK